MDEENKPKETLKKANVGAISWNLVTARANPIRPNDIRDPSLPTGSAIRLTTIRSCNGVSLVVIACFTAILGTPFGIEKNLLRRLPRLTNVGSARFAKDY
jgi:hypothetical protein